MSVAQEQNTLSKIRERGYWRVVVRPSVFDAQHIPDYAGLFPIIERNAVRLRGWDYPHVDHDHQTVRGADWVGQEGQWDDELEIWRLYQSGQFVHYFAMAEEWRDLSSLRPADSTWHPGRYICYISTVYSFLEIYEFAARLALSPAGASIMRVEVELGNLQGRRLITESIRYPLSGLYRIDLPKWQRRWEGSQTELISTPRGLAACATREFFARLGLDLSVDVIKKIQESIGR